MNVGSVTAPDWTHSPLEWAVWYLRENGHLYSAFRDELDKRLSQYPSARVSADAVMHHIRWVTPHKATGDLVSVNSNAVSLFARLYIAERPARSGNFETRRSWVDDLSPSDLSRLTFLAARVRPADPVTPLFGGRT